MMNTVNKLVVLISTIIISGSVLGQTSDAREQVRNSTITQIRIYDDYAVIRYYPTVANSLCGEDETSDLGLGSNGWAVIDFAASETLLDNALAAKLAGRYVGLGIEGNDGTTDACDTWGGGVPTVYRVDGKF